MTFPCPLTAARRLTIALIVLAAALPLSAGERLGPGSWVSVKGSFVGDVFDAAEIEALDDRSISVKGELDEFDAERLEMRFGPLRLRLDEQTRLQDAEGNEITPSLFREGQRVKASLRQQSGQKLRVRRLRQLDGQPSRMRLEGPVQFYGGGEEDVRFVLLGIEVRADDKTAWEGIDKPRQIVDDDDVRPARGIQLGRLGRLSGEVRVDFKSEQNFDLTDLVDSDENSQRLRGRVELTLPSTPHLSGMLQLKAQDEQAIDDEGENFEEDDELRLGRAYLTLHRSPGSRTSFQIGRSRFDDRRDWLFNRDVDALRLFFDTRRWHLELSVGEELVDPVPRHEQVRNTHASATFYPARDHELTAYVLDREDSFRFEGGTPRNFSPLLIGLQANGEGKKTYMYWLEAALARGESRETKLRGHAIDAGVTLIAPIALEPSLTLGYAFGSGDDDPFDDVDRTFRQSGMQLNNGKFNGVTSFRYYGELMRPELANLHIQTAGLGLRLLRKTSIDVVYHRYDLDELASELVDASVDDRTLNLVDRYIGREWDLIVGFEELRHFEFELNLSYFEPGDAFLGPTDPAASGRLKVKYVF
jgi:alginate production protein